MDNISTLKNIIDSSKKILILTDDNPDLDNTCASYVLCNALNLKSERAILIQTIEASNNSKLATKLTKLIVKDKVPNSFIINIDNSNNIIGGIEWEKTEKEINLFISTKDDKEIDEEQIRFKKVSAKFDIVICLNIDDIDKFRSKYPQLSSIINDTTTISLRNKKTQAEVGDYEIQDDKSTAISEVVYEFLKEVRINLSKEEAEILLLGVYNATDRFTKVINPKTFSIAGEMNSLGANIANIQTLLHGFYDTKEFDQSTAKPKQKLIDDNFMRLKTTSKPKPQPALDRTKVDTIASQDISDTKSDVKAENINRESKTSAKPKDVPPPSTEAKSAEKTINEKPVEIETDDNSDLLQIPLQKAKIVPQRDVQFPTNTSQFGAPNMITPPPISTVGQNNFNPPLAPSKRG